MNVQNLIKTISVQVEVLSPVHIGDSGRLIDGIDFIKRDNRTYVVDLNRFAQWAYKSNTSEYGLPRDLLEGIKPSEASVFRYHMPGVPEKNELRSFEKNGFGEPYLPGSSLKGLFRTIFIWGLFTARGQKPDLSRLSKSRSFAAQSVERSVMGSNPNNDLFRALHVRDSQTIPFEQLQVVSVDVYPTARSNQGRDGVIISCEAVKEKTVFETQIGIDRYGFLGEAAEELGWKGKETWVSVENIALLGKAFGEQRLKEELGYYKGKDDVKLVHSFYRNLFSDQLGKLQDNQFFAQIGWGTGWNSKTLNDLVRTDSRFPDLVKQYRMTRKPETFTSLTLFPKSRQLLRSQGQSVQPMGWVRITLGGGYDNV